MLLCWRQPRRATWHGYRNWPRQRTSTVGTHRDVTLHLYTLQVWPGFVYLI
ncbi:hypothetical protein DPMN_167422 [Dreissena polymorpha]|uniref:Uncharacterized protein n=1 Tax=Dreissena polymorpha TaxID=45954 RepID=A0A9D4IYK8_DREPO|nr:hypothetical protein DPMN_167422 [Dreissena polymorpha]